MQWKSASKKSGACAKKKSPANAGLIAENILSNGYFASFAI
jgi:hypothetical protein